MNVRLIKVTQLPVIEEHLETVSEEIDERVNTALSMVVCEETLTTVRKVRAELNKELGELETMRKQVKTQVLTPYNDFENNYKESVSSKYKFADEALKARIEAVSSSLKGARIKKAKDYFENAAELRGLNFAEYNMMQQNITLSVSEKKIEGEIDAYLKDMVEDLDAISNLQYANEVLAEYKKTLNLHHSIIHVNKIHKELNKIVELEPAVETEVKPEEVSEEETEEPVLDIPVEHQYRLRMSRQFTMELSRMELSMLREFLDERKIPYQEEAVAV